MFVVFVFLLDLDINRMLFYYVDFRFLIWCWSYFRIGVLMFYSGVGRYVYIIEFIYSDFFNLLIFNSDL